jgi:hypothetical protein
MLMYTVTTLGGDMASCTGAGHRRIYEPLVNLFVSHPTYIIFVFLKSIPYRTPGGGEVFRTRSDRPWAPPSFLYNGYRAFPGGKAAGA